MGETKAFKLTWNICYSLYFHFNEHEWNVYVYKVPFFSYNIEHQSTKCLLLSVCLNPYDVLGLLCSPPNSQYMDRYVSIENVARRDAELVFRFFGNLSKTHPWKIIKNFGYSNFKRWAGPEIDAICRLPEVLLIYLIYFLISVIENRL